MTGNILVLDVGSSALKAVLFDEKGAIRASAEMGYGEAAAPHRQNPEAWWSAARVAVRALRAPRIAAIALAGTMENLIPVDRDGNALCDAILYSDPCGAAALARTRQALDVMDAAALLGNPPEPLMTAFKMMWLAEAHPEIFAAAAYFLPGAKDALALRLTGRAATDSVTATTTGLMEISGRRWSGALCGLLGAPMDRLPEILPASEILGTVRREAADDLGLDPEASIPVVNGSGDAGATTLGSSCREPGDISLYLGTTGWLARVVPQSEAKVGRPVYRLAHPAEGLLIDITPILSAGAAGAWARALLKLSESEAEAALAEADRDPADILFLPYLAGERSPFVDMRVRGAFLGLGAEHGAGAVYHSVLEGVGFAIRANLAAIDPDGTGRIRLVGGGAKSGTWPHMLADILDRRIDVPADAAVATARGAFLLAAEAFGLPAGEDGSLQAFTPREERRARIARLAAAFARATVFARTLDLGAPSGP